MLSLLSSSKSFHDPWIGSQKLNRLGVHTHRIHLASLAYKFRKTLSLKTQSEYTKQLEQNGYVIIPNFLPEDSFEQLHAQARTQVNESLTVSPPLGANKKGFGQKQPFFNGFDRYDGATLNRFIETGNLNPTLLKEITHDNRLNSLSKHASGFSVDTSKLLIYLTVNQAAKQNPDSQRVLHRDTFHNTLKFWYYLEDVTEDDGPFVYVPGSHKLTKERLKWEQHQALISCKAIQDASSLNHGGGAFRINEHELNELGYSQPKPLPVSSNTLILADTFGFHRRGDAVDNSQRLALYGWRRPWPFILKGW